jgi:predicted alpha/beta superfamily hydrolase
MNRRPLFFLLVLALGPSVTRAATPMTVGDRLELPSKVMDEERRIYVSLPASYARSRLSYPVLYMTDGEAQFLHSVGTTTFLARNGVMPEVIVVAVGNTDRTRDLSPSRDPKIPTSGGADRFLDFFEKELIPYVESNYRTAPFRILAGHSLGGLFAFHSMRARPGLFQAVIAVSPWLVYDERKELALLAPFLAGDAVRTRALFYTSGDEGKEMSEVLASVTKALKARTNKSLRFASAYYPAENHGSVVLLSHYAALRMIFDGWAMPVDPATERLVGTLGEVKKRYADLSERLGFPITPPEGTVNLLGYQALQQKNLPLAIAFFRYNAETYPESANVYDSLGDALEASGSLAEALASFTKALEIGEKGGDPNAKFFKANAERVRLRLAAPATEPPARR